MKRTFKESGFSLISVMIFGFAVLITVSSLTYIFRLNLLSIDSLASQEKVITAEDQYIQKLNSNESELKGDDDKLGDYEFENKIINSLPVFANKNVDILLYHAQPTAVSSDIVHQLLYKKQLKISKSLLYKSLPQHTMIEYNDSIIPINVPYVDIDRMSDAEKKYRLSDQGRIVDSKEGYIGYIEKEYSWFLISINGQVQVINLKDLDILDDYKVNIGWNLEKGHWFISMAIYDEQHLYIFRTSLDNLLNKFNLAVLDLSSPIDILNTPKDIAAVSWYFTKNTSEPNLAVLTSYYNDDRLTTTLYDLYYDNEKEIYKSRLKDTVNGFGDVSTNTLHLVALDPSNTLSASTLLEFVGNRLLVYSLDGSYRVKKTTMVLKEATENLPLVVKKDVYGYYILTYQGDHYYQYTYTKNSDVIAAVKPMVYPDEKIQNIVVRYGLKFIVTKKNVYVVDFDNKLLDKIEV